MKNYLAFLVLLITFNSSAAIEKIVAIVNDDPITFSELEDRVKMVAFLSNIDQSDAKKNKELRTVALNSLIDEQLLEQQEQHLGIKITEENIKIAIANIEERNKMPKGHLTNLLSSNGISVTSFKKKVANDILKYRLISEVFAPNVKLSNEQFEAVIFNHKIKDADVKINILSAKNATEHGYQKMLNLSRKLTTCAKLRQSTYSKTATLETIETKFSMLDPQIQTLVKNMKNGTHSNVVKIGDEFKILMLCSKKIENFTDEESIYLSNFLMNKKVSLNLVKYQNNLRKKAYIKIF